MNKQKIFSALLALLFFVSFSGPAFSIKLGGAVSQFDASAQDAVKALREFYSGLNEVERRAYVQKLELNSDKKMGILSDAEPTGFVQKYSPAELNGRIAVIQALASYTKALLQLSSDAPIKSIESDLLSAGNSIVAINSDFSKLTQSTSDGRLKAFSSPLSTLAAIATKHWLTQKRDVALRAAISDSSEHVKKLFSLLEADVDELYNGVLLRAANTNIGTYMSYYNTEIVPMNGKGDAATRISFGDRLIYLQNAEKAAALYASSESANPISIVRRMRKVHEDLVKWAENKKVIPGDLSTLLLDLEAFSIESNRALNAAASLRSVIRR